MEGRKVQVMKSTNVRVNELAARVALAGVQTLDGASPELAALVAERLMFRTRRREAAVWERAVLSTAERFAVHSASGRVEAWSWGRGPVVILAHGWNGRGSQLGAFVEPLLEAGFQVVAFDAPGHGASDGSTSSLVHFANAFDAVVDAVRPFFQPISGVVAHSMGGAAVMFALNRAQNRARVTSEPGVTPPRLVFIAPPIDLHDFVSTVSTGLGLSEPTEQALSSLVEARLGHRMADLQALRHATSMRAPLLVMHDEQDRAVPLECGESLVQAWPGAELRKSSGLGHNRILRDPESIATAVAFLRSKEK